MKRVGQYVSRCSERDRMVCSLSLLGVMIVFNTESDDQTIPPCKALVGYPGCPALGRVTSGAVGLATGSNFLVVYIGMEAEQGQFLPSSPPAGG